MTVTLNDKTSREGFWVLRGVPYGQPIPEKLLIDETVGCQFHASVALHPRGKCVLFQKPSYFRGAQLLCFPQLTSLLETMLISTHEALGTQYNYTARTITGTGSQRYRTR